MSDILSTIFSSEYFVPFYSFVFAACIFAFVFGSSLRIVISLFYKSVVRK